MIQYIWQEGPTKCRPHSKRTSAARRAFQPRAKRMPGATSAEAAGGAGARAGRTFTDGATLVAPAGFEPAISASPGARRAHFHGWRDIGSPGGIRTRDLSLERAAS